MGSAEGARYFVSLRIDTPADESVPGALSGQVKTVLLPTLWHVSLPAALRHHQELSDHLLLQTR